MASRADRKRRAAGQSETSAKSMTHGAPAARGLTIADVHAAYMKGIEAGFEQGREAGFKQASTHTVKCLFGATVIAAHELYGFGQTRCLRLLNRVYRVTLETLTTDEMAERALDEVGVEIDWSEPVEIAQEKEVNR